MNAKKICTAIIVAIASTGVVPGAGPGPHPRDLVSQPEEIEWTWEVRPPHPLHALPNVLLVGDSITRNYYPEVQRELDGLANLYLFSSSACVGDPRLPRQLSEFASMEDISFQVVHFNNGMHGWSYSEEEYEAAFPAYLAAIRSISPAASLIWASTTPVKSDESSGPTNARINRRNQAAVLATKKWGIAVDDQHELMAPNAKYYQDNVHFNEEGSALQGKQAVDSIRRALSRVK